MKRLLAVIMSAAMAISLCACSGSSGSSTQTTPAQASAQGEDTDAAKLDYPTKDITIVVPFDAGGGNDIYARIIAKVAMEKKMFNGVNIIVENQPGGGAAIGHTYVAKTAPADGYTLLTFTASNVSNPILKDVSYTLDDFRPIICANKDPAVLIARPDAPFDDIDGLVEYAKDHTLLINDSGFGTSSHVRSLDWTQKLSEATGQEIKYESIHLDSESIQISELMGGHADLTCLTMGEVADAILEGNVKGIGLMDTERYEGVPDLKTFAEQGYEGFIDGEDRAIACNSQVPDAIYQYLAEQFTELCSSQEFIDAMKAANLNPACESAEEYQKFIERKQNMFMNVKDFLKSGNNK